VNNRFTGADSVPEPSTWAPLGAGFLCPAELARRRTEHTGNRVRR